VARDLNGGRTNQAFEAIYGRTSFLEWIPNLTEERLVELLTTGKPTALSLYSKEVLGSMANPAYDNQ
jgi:hypothetical protein